MAIRESYRELLERRRKADVWKLDKYIERKRELLGKLRMANKAIERTLARIDVTDTELDS